MKPITSLCFFLALCSGPLSAQMIQLRTGAIVVGDVEIQEDGAKILVHVRYPKVQDVILDRKELTPKSLYSVFEKKVDRTDAQALWSIAMLAKDARMYGNAISDLLAVAKIAPNKKHDVELAIKEIRELIAADLLQAAREALAKENPRATLVYLHTIKELYPKTKAAKETRKLMTLAHDRAGKRVDIAEKTVSPERAPKVLSIVSENRNKGDQARERVQAENGKIPGGSKQRKALDRAIKYYRKAWEAARTLPVAVNDPKLRAQIEMARKVTRKLLVEALLSAATVQLARTSINNAEEYCNEACALDPENKKLRDIHKTILEAKAYGF